VRLLPPTALTMPWGCPQGPSDPCCGPLYPRGRGWMRGLAATAECIGASTAANRTASRSSPARRAIYSHWTKRAYKRRLLDCLPI
jgi:hypothetical protein